MKALRIWDNIRVVSGTDLECPEYDFGGDFSLFRIIWPLFFLLLLFYDTPSPEIDGLGDTIRDHNRSLHNLQEVLREAMTSREKDASRDRPRDVIIQPRETDSTTNSEIRDIQKTLLELQVSSHITQSLLADTSIFKFLSISSHLHTVIIIFTR